MRDHCAASRRRASPGPRGAARRGARPLGARAASRGGRRTRDPATGPAPAPAGTPPGRSRPPPGGSRARATSASKSCASTWSGGTARTYPCGDVSMACAPRALRSLTTHDWRFLAADGGGVSPQTASISSSALTGCPSRVARACSTTRSWGPRRPEPSTVSGPRTLMPTSPASSGRSDASTARIPGLYRAGAARVPVGGQLDTSGRTARESDSPGAPHEPLQPLLRLRSLVVPHGDRRHDRRGSRHSRLRRPRDRCPGHSGRDTPRPRHRSRRLRVRRSSSIDRATWPGRDGTPRPGGSSPSARPSSVAAPRVLHWARAGRRRTGCPERGVRRSRAPLSSSRATTPRGRRTTHRRRRGRRASRTPRSRRPPPPRPGRRRGRRRAGGRSR